MSDGKPTPSFIHSAAPVQIHFNTCVSGVRELILRRVPGWGKPGWTKRKWLRRWSLAVWRIYTKHNTKR